MRVLLNSDILFNPRPLRGRVSRRLAALLEGCRDMGHTVVIPETALLEFDRQQREAAATARTELENAYSILETNGVPFTKLDPGAVVQPGNLTEIASAIGVTVEVVRPTLEDFEDAHRRACLHESPQPPDAKSDEMRDLVIWAIALRLSR